MLSKTAVISTLLLSAAVPTLAAGQVKVHGSVPPASFLNYHVSSVRALSQEVTLDPRVRARLARHFHVSPSQMTSYVRQNLILTHLKQSGNYRVACVGQDGREFWVESHLPAGTAVFASRLTGRPILKLACGNPMVSSLPPAIHIADGNGGTPKFAFVPPPALTDSTPMAGLVTADVIPTDIVVASTDVTPAIVEVSPSLESIIPGTILSRGGGSFNVFPALLGGIAVAVASGGHHGSTSNSTPPPAAVPEVSTALSLGALLLLGSGAWLVLRHKRPSDKAI